MDVSQLVDYLRFVLPLAGLLTGKVLKRYLPDTDWIPYVNGGIGATVGFVVPGMTPELGAVLMGGVGMVQQVAKFGRGRLSPAK